MQPLVAGPRAGLTEQQVLDSLSWTHSTRIRWGVDLLNSTLDETGLTIRVRDGSVQWQWRAQPVEGQAPVSAAVRRQGTLTYRHVGTFNPLSVFYRPYVEMLGADGTWVRWHLGVYTATIPPYQYEGQSDQAGAMVWRPLELADRSHVWQSDENADPVTVVAGTDVVQWIRDDLTLRFHELDVTGIVQDGKTLDRDYVFESGTSWLDIYDTLLGAVGNEPLHTDADGFPISPLLVDPATRPAEHDYDFGSTVLAAAEVAPANPELPNGLRFVANGWDPETQGEMTEGNGILTLFNENVGPASRQARAGRTVLFRVDVEAMTQDELEAQAAYWAPFYFGGGGLRYTGRVGLNPRHDDSDVVFLEKPPLGISGNWLVTRWAIQLGTAEQMATMEVEMEQLTGSAFLVVPDPPPGAYGTMSYAEAAYGGPL